MRDRLIDLLRSIPSMEPQIRGRQNGKTAYIAAHIADHLLANGVIVPPCKVGDTVYQTDGVRIYESRINEICIFDFVTVFYTEGVAFGEDAIDNSIFLTREEAEKALAERSGE